MQVPWEEITLMLQTGTSLLKSEVQRGLFLILDRFWKLKPTWPRVVLSRHNVNFSGNKTTAWVLLSWLACG